MKGKSKKNNKVLNEVTSSENIETSSENEVKAEEGAKGIKSKKVFYINIALIVGIIIGVGFLVLNLTKGGNGSANMSEELLNEISEKTYTNSKQITHIGDPYVFFDEKSNKYYMTATSAGDGFDLFSTVDFKTWKSHGTIFSIYNEGAWSTHEMWGPEIIAKDGKYFLFYSGRWDKNDSPRIGVAVSDNVDGPYVDYLGKPLFDFGYAVIDNHYFKDDDGQEYLYYSRDCSENLVDGMNQSQLHVVKLNPDFKSVADTEGVLCTTPEKEWEFQSGDSWRWNEGPWMIKNDEKYYLMYSGNYYADRSYSIGYAVADSPMGPFIKYDDNLLIYSEYDEISGPGNNSVFLSPDKKELWTAYHVHTDPLIGGGDRYLAIDRLGFRDDDTMYINAPTVTQQPLPSGTIEGISLISNEAEIIPSSTKPGYRAEAINDGEIGIYKKNEKYEWVADDEVDGASVTMKWDNKRKVSSIYIYGSAVIERKARKISVELSNGQKIEDITLPTQNGEAAIIELGNVNIDWIKVTITETGFGQKEAGLSEILVFGE